MQFNKYIHIHDDDNGNENRIGEGGREGRKRKIVVDAVRETGETQEMETKKNVEKEGLVQ